MWPRPSHRRKRLFAAGVVVFVLGCLASLARAEQAGRAMQLEVILNGTPTKLIGAFTMLDSGRLASTRQELEEIGINARGNSAPAELVVLDTLFGLSYRYDEPTQRILVTTPEELLVVREYNLRSSPSEMPPLQTGWGGVLNYDVYMSSASPLDGRRIAFNGVSTTLDARAFTPYGTVSQSAILRSTLNERFEMLRLNSTMMYSDPESVISYVGGDTINSGFAWTRPIRIGGVQAQRNFGLRPDLVTLPLPAARGSAAVPSTADIYINNVKTFSQDINTGPYLLSNLPAISGSGTARVILRDASGHTTESVLPFFVSSSLLAPGMSDFSAEAGVPRLSYGTTADTYVGEPVASGSMRYGLFDWVTLMGHAEGGAGLINASAGAAIRTGSFGVATVAMSGSHFGGGTGFQSYLSYETKIFGVNVNASTQMTFGKYDDLASVTSRLQQNSVRDPYSTQSILDVSSIVQSVASQALFTSASSPKMLNRISFSMPLPFYRATLSTGFTQIYDSRQSHSEIITATLSLPIDRASVFGTAFTSTGGQRNTGFLVGMSMPLGENVTTSLSVSGGSASVDVIKPLEQQPGSWGWRVRDTEGVSAQRSAAVSYRSSSMRTEAGIGQDRKGAVATAEMEGAVVVMGGGVLLANRIDDAFAVVETGVPGIEVFHENRPVATTDSSGRALVPGLRSFQRNKIAIDTNKLPVDADVSTTEMYVAPGDRTGVRLNFAVQANARPAVVVFQGADGRLLPVGASGQVEAGESFTVGYDGRAYIKNLNPENKVTIAMVDRECRASFAYEPHPNEQVIISGVTCQ